MAVIQSHAALSNNPRAHRSGARSKACRKRPSVVYIICVYKKDYQSLNFLNPNSSSRKAKLLWLMKPEFVEKRRKKERKEAGRRGKRFQGAVRNLAVAAGMAAAAAHGRCTTPLRELSTTNNRTFTVTHPSLLFIFLPPLSPPVSPAFSSLLSPVYLITLSFNQRSLSLACQVSQSHIYSINACSFLHAHTHAADVTSGSSGDHTEFKEEAFDLEANRLKQPGWSIFLLPCNRLWSLSGSPFHR